HDCLHLFRPVKVSEDASREFQHLRIRGRKRTDWPIRSEDQAVGTESAGNKLNEWTNALKAPVRARFGHEPRNFAIDPWHGGQSLNSAAPFPVHGTGNVRFRNVIENPVQPWCRVNRLDHCIKMAGENQNIERNASTGNLRQRSLKARIGDTCWIVLLQHVPYAYPFRLH